MKLFNGEKVDESAYKFGCESHLKDPNRIDYGKLNPYNYQSNKYFSWLKGYEDSIKKATELFNSKFKTVDVFEYNGSLYYGLYIQLIIEFRGLGLKESEFDRFINSKDIKVIQH